MPRPSHTSRFDHLNNIWWGVQIIKLLIMYSSLLLCNVIPFSPKYPHPPQHVILKTPLANVPFSKWATKCHTHTKQGEKLMGDLTLMKKSQWNRFVVRMVIKSIFHWQCRSHLNLLFMGSFLSVLTDKTAKVLLYMPWRHTVGRDRGRVLLILNRGSRWRWLPSFSPWLLYSWGKNVQYPLNRSLVGCQIIQPVV
jgi:hypothetical protein